MRLIEQRPDLGWPTTANAGPCARPPRRLNVYHNGMSGGEHLVRPSDYTTRLPGMMRPDDRTFNSFNTYTFTWQPSHVAWGMNGLPLMMRTTGEHVAWRDMHGKPMRRVAAACSAPAVSACAGALITRTPCICRRNFYSPDRPMHLSFSLWTDTGSGHGFGGVLDHSASPVSVSSFKDVRRIVCEPANGAASDSSGPAWLRNLPATRTGSNSSTAAAAAQRPGRPGSGQAATQPQRSSTPGRATPSATPSSVHLPQPAWKQPRRTGGIR